MCCLPPHELRLSCSKCWVQRAYAVCGTTVHGTFHSGSVVGPNQVQTADQQPTYDQVPDSTQLVNPVRQLCYDGINLGVAHV
jgi:hypothetical protein